MPFFFMLVERGDKESACHGVEREEKKNEIDWQLLTSASAAARYERFMFWAAAVLLLMSQSVCSCYEKLEDCFLPPDM